MFTILFTGRKENVIIWNAQEPLRWVRSVLFFTQFPGDIGCIAER
jgi:hypothetical protein